MDFPKGAEQLKGTGLVLEGGGMRGVFTGGVLDFFMEKNLYFSYIVGVSAGACNAVSYLSRQKGRNKAVNIGFIKDPRYLSYRNLLKERSIFGMDFMFNKIPNELVPFNYKAFEEAEEKFVIGTTDCYTGRPVYFEKDDYDILQVLQASSSLPFVAQTVKINGKTLLDGGVSDPIPLRKSIIDGNSKHVIVLTKHPGFRREPFKAKWFAKLVYPRYKGLVNAMLIRHRVYNETLDLIDKLEEEGKAFVIRPQREVKVQRLEKDPQKLQYLYNEGYNEAKRVYADMIKWLNS